MPNAGSVFRNPENMYAGELIEKSNLKGLNINGAEVSQKHANFIVNTGNATGEDIIKLIKTVQKEVIIKSNVNRDLINDVLDNIIDIFNYKSIIKYFDSNNIPYIYLGKNKVVVHN